MLLFLLYYLPIRTVDPVYSLFKEGSDRTLFGPIQATAVHWSGVMSKIWYLFCVWKRSNNHRVFPKQLFPTLSTHWSLCMSNRVLSGQVKITGNNCKSWKLSFLESQTNTLTDTAISLIHSKQQCNLLLDRRRTIQTVAVKWYRNATFVTVGGKTERGVYWCVSLSRYRGYSMLSYTRYTE